MKKKVITEICSAMQYLVDRGEVEVIQEIETKVRYTKTKVDSFIVRTEGGKRFCITAKEL